MRYNITEARHEQNLQSDLEQNETLLRGSERTGETPHKRRKRGRLPHDDGPGAEHAAAGRVPGGRLQPALGLGGW